MILYDLKCDKEHVFEAWFKDGKSFDTQAKAGKIACPTCASKRVGKAMMAPNIASSRQKAKAEAAQQAEMRRMLVKLREQVENNCDYVGERFAEEARKIHYGEVDPRGIYGEASESDAEELAEEGIAFGRIPWLPRNND